ncbi:MAG: peptidoglycan-binding protein [Eubacteriales bacterium]|nr:peptidoglycan-binding protein [Eubacteriales bacterium]
MHKKEKTIGGLKRLAAWLLSLAVLLSLAPSLGEAVSEYGMTIKDTVNIRPGMNTSDYMDRLPLGWVAKILETIEGGDYTWYKVETKLPIFPNREATQGYLRGDVFRPFSEAEEASWLVGKPQIYGGAAAVTPTTTGGTVTPAPVVTEPPSYQAPSGYVKIILANTNLRDQPESSKIFGQIPKGKILPYYGDPVQKGSYQWQYVFFEDKDEYGYIRSDCYEYTTLAGDPTAKPSAAAVTASPAPQVPGTYALTKISGANLRQTPGGIAVTALLLHAQLSVLEGPANGWFKVQSGNYTGFVQEDHIRVLSQAEAAAWLANRTLPEDMSAGTTPAPTAAPAASGYLSITLPGTNLRATPGGTSLFKFDVGTILPYTGAPVYHANYYWAYVTHDRSGLKGYVRSDCYVITDGGSSPVVTPTPAPTTPGAGQGIVRLTLGGVNLRQVPGGPVLATMPRGLELSYFNAPTYFNGYFWVYVYDQATSQYGYVRSDCYEIVEGLPQPTGGPTPAPTPVVPATGYLKLIKGGVNLRNAPAGDTLAQLDRDLELAYFSVSSALGYTWYQVESPKGRGWVRSDVIEVTKGPDVPGETPTPTPSVPTPTPPVGELGYILTTKSAINLRQTPGSSNILGRVDIGLVLALTAPVQSAQGYNWYQVTTGGRTGFLRGDCVRPLTAAEVIDYMNGKMPGPTPPPGGDPATAGYVLTTMTSVNVRESPSLDARTLGQIAASGSVLPYESTVTAGGSTWFKIIFQEQTGYLLGSTARMMTVKEYQDYLATRPTPSPTPAPTPTPDPADLSATAITRMDKVLLRQTPGGKTLTTLYKQGTILALQGAQQQADNYTWHSVRTLGVNGWIRGDMIRILTKDEEKALNQTGDPDAPPTASYRRLEIGSSGEDVTRLQRELNRIGYLESAYISGIFDAQTRESVKLYQKAMGLIVDGIAGNDTQHKLFNTVPEDTYEPGTGGTVSPTIYPVEKALWETDVKTFWARGETAILTDVRTKISFRVKRHEGGLHADVEPLTAADTAAMCRVYGVQNAQEILEKNLYQRRPVWITLKGRSFAASIYGVPHNYPAGDFIPDNNFNGQFCVHFVGSKIHSSGTVDNDHQKAITEAYNAAPVKK